MDQLRFTGLHTDGEHLVVTASDGSDFVVPIDDRLRAALRRPPAGPSTRTAPATPREVQMLVRAGRTAEEVCETTGWTIERVQRYEGPIVAERVHIAARARGAAVRTHERTDPAPTLESRVRDRLHVRGVDLEDVTWDSTRPDGGGWSVQVRFVAGQRVRQASWSFDPVARSVEAIDDEARWLSEDEQSLPAEAASAALFGPGAEAPDDLTSTMRARSRRRGHPQSSRRRSSAEGAEGAEGASVPDPAVTATPREPSPGSDPSAVPGGTDVPDAALPLEHLPYDPDTMGPPPAAGGARGAGGHAVEEEPWHQPEPSEEERESTLADFFGAEGEETDSAPLAGADESAQQRPPGPADADSSRSRKGRASVPSWDDIMFGARDRRG